MIWTLEKYNKKMGSPCLFTRQQSLKLGYFYWLRVKHSNPLLTELSLCYLKHTKFYLEHKASFIQISSIASFNSFLIACCGDIALFRTVPWLAWSPRLDPNTPNTKLFSPKKSCSTIKLFSSSNMFFIRLFLANTWEKNRGSPCLFLRKLLWKVDMALRSQSGWIICAAGTGARYKIKPIVFEVCTQDQARFRLVFMCLISATQKFKLEKNTLNTKEWGKSRFDEILELRIFILDYFVALVFYVPVS